IDIRRRNLFRIGNLLAKLKYVTIIVAYCELTHAVIEILDRINHVCATFNLVPQSIHICRVEIERSCEHRLLKWLMRVGQADHQLDIIFSQRRPAFHSICTFKAKQISIIANRLVNTSDGQDWPDALESHAHSSVIHVEVQQVPMNREPDESDARDCQ